MKYLYLLFSIFVVVPATGQTLVDTNKVWHVVYCQNLGPCGTFRYQFGTDTIINSLTYKKLNVDLITPGFFLLVDQPIAAREDTVTQQVFFYYNYEVLAYDFSLNQGDLFEGEIGGGCTFQLTVDSVDSVTLDNGELRKRLYLNNWNQEVWIEGIGCMYGLPYAGFYYCNLDIYPELNCFTEDSILKYHDTSYPSCIYTTLGVSDLEFSPEWSLYPNPFHDFTTITFKNYDLKNGIMKIFDSLGRIRKVIHNLNGTQLKFDRSDLADGFYVFRLYSENAEVIKGKILVE